jgi:hypothetical protein
VLREASRFVHTQATNRTNSAAYFFSARLKTRRQVDDSLLVESDVSCAWDPSRSIYRQISMETPCARYPYLGTCACF